MEKVNGEERAVEPYEKDEERTADPYRFDVDQNGIPLFTNKNQRFVNGMVENDSNYNQSDDKEISKIFKGMIGSDEKDRMACIGRAVYEIDNANSTHLTAVGRYKVDDLMETIHEDPLLVKAMPGETEEKKIRGGALFTAQIINGIENLEERLREGDGQLVSEIAYAAKTRLGMSGINVNKNNFSFATKFCHWACLYLELDDNYCIYDNVVASVFPYFVNSYAVGGLDSYRCSRVKKGRSASKRVSTIEDFKKKNDGYVTYREMYDAVLKGINEWRSKNGQNGEIGYHEVDRLLWYYFKGANGKRIEQALAAIDC